MSRTIAGFKSALASALHGTNLNRVQGLDDIIYRAAGDLLLDLDPRETKRIAEITNALYDEVYDYVLPSDLKGKKIVDIRPQVSRDLSDNVRARYTKEFDHYKNTNTFTIKDNSGVKSLRIATPGSAGILLHDCNSLTADGTWAATSPASGLELDELYYITGAGSLRFDTTTGGYIQNSTFAAVDLSDHEDQSAIFLWLYIPTGATPSNLTSVELRWGSSTTAYWSKSVTANHDTTAFQNGWNLLRFDWSTATQTLSPDSSAVDFLRVTITCSGTLSDLRVDSIMSKLPEIWEIEYYSKFLFKTAAGTWQETISADSNIVNLDTESYSLLFDRVMILLAPQLQGKDSAFDLNFYTKHYEDGRKAYLAANKSEAQRPQSFYYRNPTFRRRS